MVLGGWLGLLIAGLIIYVITLAPKFPPEWRPFVQGIAGILIIVGLILLVVSLFLVPVTV